MTKTFLGTALAFPPRPDGRGGLALSKDVDAVQDSIRAIIQTMKGAHQLEPWLGLPSFVFEPMPSTRAAAEVIKDAIIDGDDRVDAETLTVVVGVNDSGIADVTVTYQVLGDATTRTLAQGYRELTT